MSGRPERPDPLWIRAGHLPAARARAIDLGLPASPSSPFWRFLHEAYQLRGRKLVRVVQGYDWPFHPRAEDVGEVLNYMAKARPGSVIYVHDRAEVLEVFPELARPWETAHRPQVDDGPAGMTEVGR